MFTNQIHQTAEFFIYEKKTMKRIHQVKHISTKKTNTVPNYQKL